MFLKNGIHVQKVCIFVDVIDAGPSCPAEFPALQFPTERRPDLAGAPPVDALSLFLWQIFGILLLVHP